jgi:C-terminal processing protease CtpA/Prc
MAVESTAKIGVNVAIAAAAAAALIQLIPHHMSQQAKLREVRVEVKQMEKRVSDLQEKLSRNLDPRQANSIRQEQAFKFEPNQIPIVVTKQEQVDNEAPESLP